MVNYYALNLQEHEFFKIYIDYEEQFSSNATGKSHNAVVNVSKGMHVIEIAVESKVNSVDFHQDAGRLAGSIGRFNIISIKIEGNEDGGGGKCEPCPDGTVSHARSASCQSCPAGM